MMWVGVTFLEPDFSVCLNALALEPVLPMRRGPESLVVIVIARSTCDPIVPDPGADFNCILRFTAMAELVRTLRI
jgi:hypothetical protein